MFSTRNQDGYSLIETAVAMAVFALVGIMLLGTLAISARSVIINDKLSRAETLARAQMEYIQSQPYTTPNSYLVLPVPSDFNGFVYDSPIVTPVADGLQMITVRVLNGNTSFTLEGYKVNR
ncbi:MAG: type II secretion system protein [Chloroflexi bacterium]|nr:type II secretion system protein [Chloroflexota bacterium]